MVSTVGKCVGCKQEKTQPSEIHYHKEEIIFKADSDPVHLPTQYEGMNNDVWLCR